MKKFTEYNEQQINEGFWKWLGDLIMKLFENDPEVTPETRRTSADLLGALQSRYKISNDEMAKLEKLLKENNIDKFIEIVEAWKKQCIDKNILDENAATAGAMTLIQVAILKNRDRNNKQGEKKLLEKLEEYKKENKEVAQQLEDDAKEIEKKRQQELEQAKKNIDSEYKKHQNVIESIFKSDNEEIKNLLSNTSESKLKESILNYCNSNKITDPHIFYGLALMKFGFILEGSHSVNYGKKILSEIK